MKIKLLIGSIITVILMAMMFSGPNENFSLRGILLHSVMPLLSVILFWINYLWLAKYFAQKNGKWRATLYNIIIIATYCIFLSYWHTYEFQQERKERFTHEVKETGNASVQDARKDHERNREHDEEMRGEGEAFGMPPKDMDDRHMAEGDTTMPPMPREDMRPQHDDMADQHDQAMDDQHYNMDEHKEWHKRHLHKMREKRQAWKGRFGIMPTLRDILNFIFAIIVAYYIRSREHIAQLQQLRQQAETAQRDAELRSLRNQISPHFLLNTLNNIYALAGISTERTKDAIMQLSKMLRHMLYDNQAEMVTLSSEVEFIRSYVDLMRLRQAQNVKVETLFDINPGGDTMVAPLLFISLVENAFKHGVSANEPCMISIKMTENEESIICDISNSNHPKQSNDRSGHGVGLELVQQRLDMVYPDRYSWIKGVGADGLYHSIMEIKITTNHNS